MARILYLGESNEGSTSRHRADALRRVGHEVFIANPYLSAGDHLRHYMLGAVHLRTGYRFLQRRTRRWIADLIRPAHGFDVAWVDGGELLGGDCVRLLAAAGLSTVLYNHDDPTGSRDGRRFESLLAALPHYDVCAVVRHENVDEYKSRGAKSVIKIWRGYDEVMHAPYPNQSEVPAEFKSEVAFIGTWMRTEGRDEFLLHLTQLGVPLSIWGHRWERSPMWKQLKSYYRGGNLHGRDYAAAIQGAKVCLGLLSKGNRDLHTTRTMEIPFAGGVLCAERTSEHMHLYRDGVEAVFWNDADECARQCLRLLDDESWRNSVRNAGMARVRALGVGHEQTCQPILHLALQVRQERPVRQCDSQRPIQ